MTPAAQRYQEAYRRLFLVEAHSPEWDECLDEIERLAPLVDHAILDAIDRDIEADSELRAECERRELQRRKHNWRPSKDRESVTCTECGLQAPFGRANELRGCTGHKSVFGGELQAPDNVRALPRKATSA